MARPRPLAVTLLALSLLCMGITAPSASASPVDDDSISYAPLRGDVSTLDDSFVETIDPLYILRCTWLFCCRNR